MIAMTEINAESWRDAHDHVLEMQRHYHQMIHGKGYLKTICALLARFDGGERTLNLYQDMLAVE